MAAQCCAMKCTLDPQFLDFFCVLMQYHSTKITLSYLSFFSSILCLQPIERKPLVYQPDSVMFSHSQDLDNLPDEFFEVTVDDVRKRFAMLKSER